MEKDKKSGPRPSRPSHLQLPRPLGTQALRKPLVLKQGLLKNGGSFWRRSAQRRSDIQPVNATMSRSPRRTARRWPPGHKNLSPREGLTPPRRKGGALPSPSPCRGGKEPQSVLGARCSSVGARLSLRCACRMIRLASHDHARARLHWKCGLCDVRCAVATSVSFVSFPLAKENLSFPVGKEEVPLPRGEGGGNALGICDRCLSMHLPCER